MSGQLVHMFRASMKEAIERRSSPVIEGACSTFESYKQETGVVLGMEIALTILDETLAKLEKDEDD